MKNLKRWLTGEFTCTRCGRTHHVMTFGFGKSICPDCYKGEDDFLFPDASYVLNRLLLRLGVGQATGKVNSL